MCCVRYKFETVYGRGNQVNLPNNLPRTMVGTPSRFTNIFIAGRDGSQEECTAQLRCVLAGIHVWSRYVTIEQQEAYRAFVIDNIEQLRSHNLGCWCDLARPCHADVLIEFAANWREADDG